MIDDHDIARLDEIYVRKDDCKGIQSGVEKNLPTILRGLPFWNTSKS